VTTLIKRLAIIPARAGSKRIPGKNLRLFRGKPIVAYSIECAKKSNLFERIHVSTDDDKISGVAKSLGHQPEFMRLPELADDHTPLMAVLKYTIEKYEEFGLEFDEIVLIMACAPLILPEDLITAVKLLGSTPKANGVIGVCKFPTPVARSYRMGSDNMLVPEFPEKMQERSQDLPEDYYDAGQFCVFRTPAVKASTGAGEYKNLIGYELPPHRAVDIDTEDDWLLAEKLYRA
jgi:N-acylneuraminate cytidylyltransferase